MPENEMKFMDMDGTKSNQENESKKEGQPRFKTKRRNLNAYGGFRGKTREMDAHVLQVHCEQRRKRQFELTLKQLQVFAPVKFNKHAQYLAPLFKDLSPPIVPQPVLKTTGQDSSGNSFETQFDTEVYKEKIKLWIKEENALESTTQALFTVIF